MMEEYTLKDIILLITHLIIWHLSFMAAREVALLNSEPLGRQKKVPRTSAPERGVESHTVPFTHTSLRVSTTMHRLLLQF